MGGADLSDGHCKDYGEYGEEARESEHCRIRRATALERIPSVGQEPELQLFLPQLVLALAPSVPDVFAEYCRAYGRDLELILWVVDYPLIPALSPHGIDTTRLFGVRDEPSLIPFISGLLLESEADSRVYRLLTQAVEVFSPSQSSAGSSEKLVAGKVCLHVLCLQTTDELWCVRPAPVPRDLEIVRRRSDGDPGLLAVGERFWRRGKGTDILDYLD